MSFPKIQSITSFFVRFYEGVASTFAAVCGNVQGVASRIFTEMSNMAGSISRSLAGRATPGGEPSAKLPPPISPGWDLIPRLEKLGFRKAQIDALGGKCTRDEITRALDFGFRADLMDTMIKNEPEKSLKEILNTYIQTIQGARQFAAAAGLKL